MRNLLGKTSANATFKQSANPNCPGRENIQSSVAASTATEFHNGAIGRAFRDCFAAHFLANQSANPTWPVTDCSPEPCLKSPPNNRVPLINACNFNEYKQAKGPDWPPFLALATL